MMTYMVVFIATGQYNGVCTVAVSTMNTSNMRTMYARLTNLQTELHTLIHTDKHTYRIDKHI